MECRNLACAAALSALINCLSGQGWSQAPQSQGGISIDRYRLMFPPAPANVRAELRDGKAIISWDRPPEPPPGKIGYDPAVASYRIYLLDSALERTLIGTTKKMSLEDKSSLSPGMERHYAVTAVQRSGVESGMSQEAVLRVPTN